MERGFKTRCEEMSRSLRAEIGLVATTPLRPDQLASYLDVAVWSVAELGLDESDLNQLIHEDPDAWSAITVSALGREAIVVNPKHRGGRYSSDVMHEFRTAADILARTSPTNAAIVRSPCNGFGRLPVCRPPPWVRPRVSTCQHAVSNVGWPAALGWFLSVGTRMGSYGSY